MHAVLGKTERIVFQQIIPTSKVKKAIEICRLQQLDEASGSTLVYINPAHVVQVVDASSNTTSITLVGIPSQTLIVRGHAREIARRRLSAAAPSLRQPYLLQPIAYSRDASPARQATLLIRGGGQRLAHTMWHGDERRAPRVLSPRRARHLTDPLARRGHSVRTHLSSFLESLTNAEREGFEPSRRVDPAYRISSAAPSTS